MTASGFNQVDVYVSVQCALLVAVMDTVLWLVVGLVYVPFGSHKRCSSFVFLGWELGESVGDCPPHAFVSPTSFRLACNRLTMLAVSNVINSWLCRVVSCSSLRKVADILIKTRLMTMILFD